MNKARRKRIYEIIKILNVILTRLQSNDEINIEAWIEDLIDVIHDVLGDEEDVMYNIPENLQGSEMYEKVEEACDNLENAIGSLESIDTEDEKEYIIDMISEAIEFLDDAAM